VKESQQRGHSTARAWRAHSFKCACQFTMASHLAQPSLTKNSPPRPPTSPVHGKNHLAHLHRYNSPPQRGVLHGPGHSDHMSYWRSRGQAKCVVSTGHVSPWVPRGRDRHDPRPVARTRQGRAARDEGHGVGVRGAVLEFGAGLRVVTPPFARGL